MLWHRQNPQKIMQNCRGEHPQEKTSVGNEKHHSQDLVDVYLAKDGVLLIQGVQVRAKGEEKLRGIQILTSTCSKCNLVRPSMRFPMLPSVQGQTCGIWRPPL